MSTKKRAKKKATPRDQWEKLRLDTIKRIDAIDSRTSWVGSYSNWWVEMRAVRQRLQKAGELDGER
jgi:hypothetical protein